MTIEEFREAIAYLEACLRDIHTGAADEQRNLNDEERTRWDEGNAMRDDLTDQLQRAEQVEAMVANAPETSQPGDGSQFRVNKRDADDPYDIEQRVLDPRRGATELRGKAMQAIERTADWELPDSAKEHLTQLVEKESRGKHAHSSVARLVLATGSDDYKDAFEAFLRTADGSPLILSVDQSRAVERAMSLTTTAGGFAVPFPIDPTIIQLGDGSVSGFRTWARVIPNHPTDTWQGLSLTQGDFSFDAEAAEVSDDTPTWAQPSITVRMARGFVPASMEILDDYPGLLEDLRTWFLDGKAVLDDTVFATGAAGSNQPIGIVTALTDGASQIDSATTDTFAIADVYALADALPPRHRSAASRNAWCSNIAIYHDIREFGDAGNPGPFVTEANANSVLGSPWFEASAMDGAITALADNKVLIYGDWRAYTIVDRVGFSLETVPHMFATANNLPSGERGFFGRYRVGADSVNDNAFRMLDVT